MTTDPATVGVHDPVSIAKKLFEAGDIHHLPVVDDGVLVGIISSSDLLKIYLVDGNPAVLASATVGQLMEPDPVILESGASLRDGVIALSNGGYHALPVVDSRGTLVGIVTTGDLLSHLLRQIESGDGSIHEIGNARSEIRIGDDVVSRAIREAEEAAARGGDPGALPRVILHLRNRNRMLEHTCKAAELYLRSGHGEREHSVLVKRLADVRTQ